MFKISTEKPFPLEWKPNRNNGCRVLFLPRVPHPDVFGVKRSWIEGGCDPSDIKTCYEYQPDEDLFPERLIMLDRVIEYDTQHFEYFRGSSECYYEIDIEEAIQIAKFIKAHPTLLQIDLSRMRKRYSPLFSFQEEDSTYHPSLAIILEAVILSRCGIDNPCKINMERISAELITSSPYIQLLIITLRKNKSSISFTCPDGLGLSSTETMEKQITELFEQLTESEKKRYQRLLIELTSIRQNENASASQCFRNERVLSNLFEFLNLTETSVENNTDIRAASNKI